MVFNRSVSKATGQNAYSQALEKELKQATKALPASSWSSPRPQTQAYVSRQRKSLVSLAKLERPKLLEREGQRARRGQIRPGQGARQGRRPRKRLRQGPWRR
jgi:hypothetical protein